MNTFKEFIDRKESQFEKCRSDFMNNPRKSLLIKMKDIGRKGHHYYLRSNWTLMQQHNNDEKVFIIERLELQDVSGKISSRTIKEIGHIEYRIGYFIVGKNGNRIGKWTWGQFCPMIPCHDLGRLINKAVKEGTILSNHLS